MRPSVLSAAAFGLRHRWGLLTLAIATVLWAAGAFGTPAPAVLGATLAVVLASLLLAVVRLGLRRRRAFAPAERRRTGTSMALHTTSLCLAALFLAGLFVAPGPTGVATSAVQSPAVAATLGLAVAGPAAGSAFAAPRVAGLPALHELGDRRPLLAERGTEGPMAELRAADPDRDDERLRVLSFNVWHGYPGPGDREERFERIRDLLIEVDPDLVLLQESWRTRRFGGLAERLSDELGYGFAYTRANGSLRYLGFEEGLAILSRHPISDVRRLTLGPRMPPWEMRAALGASITIPGFEPLEVWTTHLSHADAFAREGQARTLAGVLAGSPVAIVAGDFNAGAASPAVAAFAEIDLEPVLSSGIDHVLLSPAMREHLFTTVRAEALHFGQVEVPGTLLTRPEVSDHPALVVELRRRAQGRRGPRVERAGVAWR